MYLSFPFNPYVGAVLAALSLPHLLYFFVWLRSPAFISFSKKLNMPALDLFYKISVGLKFVQFTALGIWGFKTFPAPNMSDLIPVRLVVGVALATAGQILNGGVYKALGKAGVYYGVKFGLSIPWYEGFPFTVVKHPQYVGCILTIWGMVSIFFAPEYIDLGLLTVASVWTMYYMFSGFIENTF